MDKDVLVGAIATAGVCAVALVAFFVAIILTQPPPGC